MHAALALNTFYHNRARFVSITTQNSVHIRVCIFKALKERIEIFMKFVLPGGRERGNRAAVKGIFERYYLISAILRIAVLAGNFYGTLVSLGAAVAEEHLLRARLFAQELCQLCLGHRIVQVGRVLNFVELCDDRALPHLVAHAEDVYANAAGAIYVLLAVYVVQPAPFAPLEGDVKAGLGRSDILFIVAENLVFIHKTPHLGPKH